MRIFVAILALCMLTSGARAENCGLTLYDSMDFDVSSNHALLPVTIGDVHKEFALEIGAGLNGISENIATELGLDVRSITSRASFESNGVEITRHTFVPKFKLGNLPVSNLEFLVLPPEANLSKLDGYIGLRILSRTDFEIDLAGKKFNLFSQDHCPGEVVYWKNSSGVVQIPFVWESMGYVRPTMQLDGQQVRVAFSLNGPSTIGMNAMRRLFGLDGSSPQLIPNGQDERGRKLFKYAFKSLDANGLTILAPDIQVVDEPPRRLDCISPRTVYPGKPSQHEELIATCFGLGDVVLGYSVLSKLRMYFALKEKKLYLTAADSR